MIQKLYLSKILLNLIALCLLIPLFSTEAVETVLPKKTREISHSDCELAQLKQEMETRPGVTVSSDPAGASFESLQELNSTFKAYAEKNKCEIYVINMNKLIKGLLKGNNIQEDMTGRSKGNSYKYITMEGKKARCAKTLGLKLPIEEFGETEK